MPNTTNLGLPYIDANQNQKYVTHNDALSILDALVQIQAQSANLAAPPSSPADGQCWIVAAGATGAWTGKDLQIAAWQDGAWNFYPPRAGYLAYNVAASTTLVWTGSAWISILAALSTLTLTALGIGTAADPGNPLSVTANNALFSALGTGAGGTGDMRIKLNKAASANTASFLYQDGFSGRAEIGLAGDDNFRFKVSSNGSTWYDAMDIAGASGTVSFLNAPILPGVNGGALAGFRNRLNNGNFAINQRGTTSGAALAAGAYGFDRWKAGSGGATISFTAGVPDTMLTIGTGTLLQMIEAANVEGGAYALSWTGTATARVYQGSPTGSYAASPILVTGLAAGTNTTIEFATGTLGLVQFEPGPAATFFERRPIGIELALCQRFFQTSYPQGTAPGTATFAGALALESPSTSASPYLGVSRALPVAMRAAPTATFYSPKTGTSANVTYFNASTASQSDTTSFTTGTTGVSSTSVEIQLNNVANATAIFGQFVLSADL